MKAAENIVGKEAFKSLKEQGVKFKPRNDKKSKANKYSKDRYLHIYRGYNLLENSIVIRHYIQKRYSIDYNFLEILLYLFPKQYFTSTDYGELPKQYTRRTMRSMLKSGYINIMQKGSNLNRHVYCLNRAGKEIVIHYYECLSGEKKVLETTDNPMTRSDVNKFTKKKMDLIRKINQLPVPESKKGLFE